MRTKGSGWGAGPILYQICPKCNRKKAYYDWQYYIPDFRCSWCKERFDSNTLLKLKYISQLESKTENHDNPPPRNRRKHF